MNEQDLALLNEHRSKLSAPHDPEGALAIIKACLALDVPITDLMTGAMWWGLVSRVAELERRVYGSSD